ncbi:MAG: hypothetical protein GY754_18620 [bacterium]|nr:hypothetical protein [bacterium]
MKKRSTLIAIFLLLCGVLTAPGHTQPAHSYTVLNGKIVKTVNTVTETLPVKGTVLHVSSTGDELFYISLMADEPPTPTEETEPVEKKTAPESLYIGYINIADAEKSFESKLPLAENTSGNQYDKYTFRRFLVNNGKVYLLLTEQNPEQVTMGTMLFILTIENKELVKYDKIPDAAIVEGKFLYLQGIEGDSTLICINGEKKPLTIQGNSIITQIVDKRMVFISNGREREIFDLKRMKSVFQYSPELEYAEPGEYNLLFEAIDAVKAGKSPAADKLIYYNIYINGVDAGRTATGLSVTLREFKGKLEPGKTHIIKFERMELNRSKNRYVRLNNISQPRPLRTFIPENRIIKIELKYNGKKYGIKSFAVFK